MTIERDIDLHLTRRQLFGLTARGIGGAALGSLLSPELLAAGSTLQEARDPKTGGLTSLPHFAPKAKRVIFLHQSGGPSQLETVRLQAGPREVPGDADSGLHPQGQRVTGMTIGADRSCRWRGRMFKFAQHGQAGTWVSELLPHTAKIVDDITIIKIDAHRRDQSRSGDHVHPDRHSAAGPPEHGRVAQLRARQREPESAGVRRAALAGARDHDGSAALLASLGQRLPALELPGRAGFAPAATPVLYLADPPGHHRGRRGGRCSMPRPRSTRCSIEAYGDPEIETRIAQYEMAYRMQTSVPDLTDLSKEPDSIFEMYGPDVAQARHATRRIACWRGASRSATCGSFSSTTAAGISTATCRATSRCSAGTPISRPRRS